MPKVAIDKAAPDFEIDDYTGKTFRLSGLKDSQHVLLVFNRGFF